MAEGKPREVKVVLLGDTGVGKSSLVLRFVTNNFKPYSESTIGASFMSKVLMVNGKQIKFQIWDTAGQEKYHSLARTLCSSWWFKSMLQLMLLFVFRFRPWLFSYCWFFFSQRFCSYVLSWGCCCNYCLWYYKIQYIQDFEKLGRGAQESGPQGHCNCNRWKQSGFGGTKGMLSLKHR